MSTTKRISKYRKNKLQPLCTVRIKETRVFIETVTMKTFQLATLFSLVAAAMAFAPQQLPQGKRFVTIVFILHLITPHQQLT
jgi:hypothetical protein